MKNIANVEGLKAYRGHCINYYVDEKTTKSTMEANCPIFFGNKERGERHTVYRGHIIVEKQGPSGLGRRFVVYVYDVRCNDMHYISGDPTNLADAKSIIDDKLDQPNDVLELHHVELNLTCPVIVKAAYFIDKTTGQVTDAEVSQWTHIGPPSHAQSINNPGDTFTSAVYNALPQLVKAHIG